MFSKILIANRGEIACRVIRTARDMGIGTVAVFSDADAAALHVGMADEAVAIGPAAAAESYLVIDKLVAAAVEVGADAVHPGYGFLSENAEFARALTARGVVFIGPPADAIAVMGDKIEARRVAEGAGVSIIPGHDGAVADATEAVAAARQIGYPVMIKAAAGGGGKGMRIARDDDETGEGFRSATREARSSFGDGRIFIEKLIAEPRHIEIQIVADGHGNVIHLGERECSIQRRHQKVIEEAPSPLVDGAMRAAMGAQAIALARAVGYRSAGTVEFIADEARNFHFLEMNTRLQVEHPVTELITGLDIVELMIREAAGEALPVSQDEVAFRGWAIEARIYAEDPRRGFLPSSGRIVRYRAPETGPAVRLDGGIYEGAEIGIHYDPLIAKLCTHGKTREMAIDAMGDALDRTVLRGVENNIQFLGAVMANPRFRAGNLSTGFIDEEYGPGFTGGPLTRAKRDALVAIAALIDLRRDSQAKKGPRERVVSFDGVDVKVRVVAEDGGCDVRIAKRKLVVRGGWRPGEILFTGVSGGLLIAAQVDPLSGGGFRLIHGGASIEVRVRSPRAARLAAIMPSRRVTATAAVLRCPMPGLVVAINVSEGDKVKNGQPLAVVEAMKMENILRAERDCSIATIHAEVGQSLALDEVIMEFDGVSAVAR